MKSGIKIFKIILSILGSIFLFLLILSFTSAPFWIWYNLGKKSSGIHRPPDIIVVMGGGGMPSESGLMRCFYAARAANHFNRARVVIALPGDTADSTSSISGMKKELVLRGVAPERIFFEDSGTNTRAQALLIFEKLSAEGSWNRWHRDTVAGKQALLLISSPEHLHRAVLTFRKAGFSRVNGQAAWERAIESDLEFRGRKLGGRKLVPEIGDNLAVRYNFWTQMNYELLVLREWAALTYYYIKGWI
jgi:uncharacterized SAM-binding protein YcdF (DUF218 family)